MKVISRWHEMENIWENFAALLRELIKELTWLNEISRNAFLNKNPFMSAYTWLKYWLKVYWGQSCRVIHQNEQKLTQENIGITYAHIPFLQPVMRLRTVGSLRKSKENWKQLFFLWKNLEENTERCSLWPEKHILAKNTHELQFSSKLNVPVPWFA